MNLVTSAFIKLLKRSIPNEDGAFGREAVMDTDHFLMMKKVRLLSGKKLRCIPSHSFFTMIAYEKMIGLYFVLTPEVCKRRYSREQEVNIFVILRNI